MPGFNHRYDRKGIGMVNDSQTGGVAHGLGNKKGSRGYDSFLSRLVNGWPLSLDDNTWLQLPGAAHKSTAFFTPIADQHKNEDKTMATNATPIH